jgi:hypothetical protein
MAKHEAVTVNCATVEPETIDWLWRGRLAVGKVNLLVGDPGVSKSMVSLDVAARVSSGVSFPDTQHQENPAGDVVLLSAEDGLADTVVPRLMAAKARRERITVVKAVHCTLPPDEYGKVEEFDRGFSLEEDIDRLGEVIDKCQNPRLVIVDPLSAYTGGADDHRNSDLRRVLHPLAVLAEDKGVAILGITHLNKAIKQTALHRVMGSLAYVAACRTCWAVVPDKLPRQRLLLRVKSNLADETTGLRYQITTTTDDVPYVEWFIEPVTMTVDEALAAAEPTGKPTKTAEAVTWLEEQLRDGGVESAELFAKADDAGLSRRVLYLAKDKLGVKARKSGYQGAWVWYVPDVEDEAA